MNQIELIARLKNIYVFIPVSSVTARQKVAELIGMLGGVVPKQHEG
jgi:hypothetical protein